MIVIFSDYDAESRVLARYARTFLAESVTTITVIEAGPPGPSDSSTVQGLLRSHPEIPISFFGHGVANPPRLIAQDRSPWLDEANADLVEGRHLCAVSCHSLDEIAARALRLRATVLGYSGELFVPLKDPYIQWMEAGVLAAPRALRESRDPARLLAACDQARQDYRALARRLQESDDPEHRLVAPFMRLNARSHGMKAP